MKTLLKILKIIFLLFKISLIALSKFYFHLTLQITLFKKYVSVTVEAFLERFFLQILKWFEYTKNLIIYWVIFIILMSLCVRNEYGYDIETTHFVIFSLAMAYGMHLHKEFYPKETNFVGLKLVITCLVVLQVFWPLFLYVWPFYTRRITLQEIITIIIFVFWRP